MAGSSTILYLELNPSIADASICDPTLNRCVNFSKALGFGGIVNLYAMISTNPDEIKHAEDPVGPENDRYIVEVAESSKLLGICLGRKVWKYKKKKKTGCRQVKRIQCSLY
ncbi:DUF1643 domain-containing protein [Fictibacillus enclensis]|uniref:DUF1643 domain-containing protein n=1 Tax=Fictibacillus enclensis TaxID=1017270 RepID=UPI0025A1056F|nr:DUF1643 domain-containing protein [Fictibacillus enclensis]MDM5196606.1 DUF1643 domain-containing protein [Fictibacillus enclensis]